MKINYNELSKKDAYGYLDVDKANTLANVVNLLSEKNLNLIVTSPDWISEKSFDMSVTINGKELNPTLFLENLVEKLLNNNKEIRELKYSNFQKTNEEIENFKEKWKSKNSSASRLNRLNEQMSQVKNILNNIENSIKEIK